MNSDKYQFARKSIDLILKETICPVARMRLLSRGVGINNQMLTDKEITGDKGCLACGNCLDACPVVRDKRRFVFLHNQRTSMSLENIVDLECRRCYNCVQACPQVNKSVKEYVLGIRRVEKMIHALLSVVIFALAATGILIYHYGEFMAPVHHDVYRYFHITLGIALFLMPALYYLADKKHFKRVFDRAFKFNMDDVKWVQGLWAHLKRPNRFPMPYWGEFNTYQKFWYVYLSCIVTIFALTGLIKIFAGLNDTRAVWLSVAMTIHVAAAFCTDVLVFIHIYIKYLKNIKRACKDMLSSWHRKRNLQYAFLYAPKTENQYSNIPDTFGKN